jgi:hypothetical protein
MGSRRLIAAIGLAVVALAGLTSTVAARTPKSPEPVPREEGVPGEYQGHVRTETFPSLAHPARFALAFSFAGGEVRRLQTTLPLACGEKELDEAPIVFDYEFGTQGAVARAPGGIFKVTERAQIEAAEAPAGSARVRIVIHGWFDGPTALGNYRVISSDGSSCSAGGRWSATRIGG